MKRFEWYTPPGPNPIEDQDSGIRSLEDCVQDFLMRCKIEGVTHLILYHCHVDRELRGVWEESWRVHRIENNHMLCGIVAKEIP